MNGYRGLERRPERRLATLQSKSRDIGAPNRECRKRGGQISWDDRQFAVAQVCMLPFRGRD